MTLEYEQIVSAYEVASMSVTDIAEQYELDESYVKSILWTHSRLYRESLDTSCVNGVLNSPLGNEDVNDAEFKEIKSALMGVVRYAEDNPAARVKAAIFLWNEKKGRNDSLAMNGAALGKLGGGNTYVQVNINNLTERQKKAQNALVSCERKIKLADSPSIS